MAHQATFAGGLNHDLQMTFGVIGDGNFHLQDYTKRPNAPVQRATNGLAGNKKHASRPLLERVVMRTAHFREGMLHHLRL